MNAPVDAPVSEPQALTDQAAATIQPKSASGAVHLNALDGLRALACIVVVWHHCYSLTGATTAFDAFPNGSRHWDKFLYCGYLSVDVFFILSAFCLALPVLKKGAGSYDWKTYAIKRVRRIYPAYFFAFVFFWIVGEALLLSGIEPRFSGNHLGPQHYKLLLMGLFFIQPYFSHAYWTLVLEARWYIVLPFLLILMRKIGWNGILIVSLAVSAAYYLCIHSGNHFVVKAIWILTALPFFLPVFVAGIGMAWLVVRVPNLAAKIPFLRSWIWLGFIVSCLSTRYLMQMPMTVIVPQRLLIGASVAIFSLALAIYDDTTRRFLSTRLFRWLAAFSYSIYLIHYPLVELFHAFERKSALAPVLDLALTYVVLPCSIVVLSYFFYLVAERPYLLQNKRMAQA